MSIIPITTFTIEPVGFLIDYFQSEIASYNLEELTNGHVADVPSINNVHPLAIEFGNYANNDGEKYTSILPAIGIELLEDNESPKQVLGQKKESVEIDEAYLDAIEAIELKKRIEGGVILSDTQLAALQQALEDKEGEKLWGERISEFKDITILVSIWCQDYAIRKILYLVVESLLRRFKQYAISNGVKNLKLNAQSSLYNYDTDRTLFGAEFHLSFMQRISITEVNAAIETINKIEEVAKDATGNEDNINTPNLHGVTGKNI